MYTSRVTLCVVAAMTTVPLTAQADDLALTVSTDKDIYEFGQPIMLTITVWNHGVQTYTLDTTPFDRPAHALLGTWPPPGERVHPLPEHYVGIIKSPKGRAIHSYRRYGMHAIDRRPLTIILQPGESHTVTLNLRDHYPVEQSAAGGSAASLDMPGTYELSAKYHLYYAHNWPDEYAGIFIGPIQSNTVKFVVKPLEGARLEQLLHQLDSEDVGAQAQALSLLRRGRAVNRIHDLLQFLKRDQPRELRIAAARAIYDMPDPNAWEDYTEFLDDPSICGFMALALGKIGNKAAGDALYAVTDPERYPRPYWLAFEALIQIGDPRAKEVSARLAESAESPALRKLAAKFLREGVLREGSAKPANTSQKKKP